MIRVNLLPNKREARAAAASSVGGDNNRWALGALGMVVVAAAGLFFWYVSLNNQLTAYNTYNSRLQANIDEIKRLISDHDAIKAQLKDLRDREEAVAKLQAARTGPTTSLLEISKLLTNGKGPTTDRDKLEQLKRDNPGSVPNPSWDPRRLWILSYLEQDRKVKIVGQARDGEDVSEFLRRISLSDYFHEVQLLPASKSIDSATKIELVRFELSAKVRY